MDLQRKIAILGSTGVGKTSLVRQFVEAKFEDIYHPTVMETFTKNYSLKDVKFSIQIVDTAGQDEFSRIPKDASVGVHGYVLVYSVTSRKSFEMINVINESLLNQIGADTVPLVLVANKADLAERHEVSREEGKRLAEKWRCPFVEGSAREHGFSRDVFNKLITVIEKETGLLGEPTETTTKKKRCVLF